MTSSMWLPKASERRLVISAMLLSPSRGLSTP
jgi:hypothetical protein